MSKLIPELKSFKVKEDAQKYKICTEFVATSFDVAVSKLFHKSDKNVKVLKKGKKYTKEHIPFSYFKYKGTIWPVYDDDCGQQDFIYIDGEFIGAGAYNFESVEYFVSVIDNHESK